MENRLFIELNKVSKQYKTVKAVDELSLQVFEGDIYGFLGPNGAGKSTSIRMILSLIKPTSGQINLFNHDLAENRYKTLSRIGAIIEKPDFYNYLSARNNLRILGKLANAKNLQKKIDESLEIVGLSHRAESRVKTFSHGMKQRLGIAQALLHNPDLIILDEPANGLDPQGQKEMRDLILRLNKDEGKTILLSSHILSEIEQIANRMVIINKGKSIVEGEVQQLLDSGDMKVTFTLDDYEKARASLNTSKWVDFLRENNDNQKLVFDISKDQIPELTQFFLEQKLNIYAVEPIRSLEEYFIKITGNA